MIKKLGLAALEPEGGFFAETYKAQQKMETKGGERAIATAIYYLVTPQSFSRLHRLQHTEIYHFYAGARAELTLISPDGVWKTVTLGSDLAAGDVPQVVVPPLTWQAVMILSGEKTSWSLLGTTMAPGFDMADFEMAKRKELAEKFPSHKQRIVALTVE